MAEERIKYFSLEEANRTLPYVRPIVADIVKTYGEWRAGVKRYEELASLRRGDQTCAADQRVSG